MQLPKLRAKYEQAIGTELFFSFPEIQDDPKTYLDADAAAGTSFTANGTAFGVSQYIVVGQQYALKTEIAQIHSATIPTASLITLASSTSFTHNRGDAIRFIPYNQIVPERSTDAGANFTPLSAISIRADATETYLQRTSDASTDVYRFRFFNSTTGLYSAYSASVAGTGYADNTIWSVKNRALRQMGEKIGGLITDSDLNDWLQEARRALDYNPLILRWTFRTKFNTSIGQCVAGKWKVAVPTDLRDQNTYKNILGLRIGKQARPCTYLDRKTFNQYYYNVGHSTLNGAVISGATSITLTSSANFDDSGTVTVSGSGIGVDSDSFTYTANNRSTNVISGVTGVPAAGYATGSEAWQDINFGTPIHYTVDAGYIYFDLPFEDALDGQAIYMDYYSSIPAISSDSQTFDEPFYDLYVSFLKWKIAYKKSNGRIDQTTNTDYIDWQKGSAMLIAQETSGQRVSFVPTDGDADYNDDW